MTQGQLRTTIVTIWWVLFGLIVYLGGARFTATHVYNTYCNRYTARGNAHVAGALWPVVLPLYVALGQPCTEVP